MQAPQVSLIIPLYNEEKTIPHLVTRLNELIKNTDLKFEIVLIDDGSTDNTAVMCQQISLTDEKYHSIFLSRNYGHQIALSAGIEAAQATEALMILDGDLQDPPELFPEFYKYIKDGYDVVYGVRQNRKENYFKRSSYYLFYRILKSISYIDIPLDSGDFSMISRRVADIIKSMPEQSRYIRGMRSWVGFKQTGLVYERKERFAGSSKYSLKMLFSLAFNGIFNFSEIPIRFITRLGISSVVLSLIYFTITLFKKLILHDVPVGFTALLFMIILFGGVQLISLGIIGEYIVRIFFQVKGRPLYLVTSEISNKKFIYKNHSTGSVNNHQPVQSTPTVPFI